MPHPGSLNYPRHVELWYVQHGSLAVVVQLSTWLEEVDFSGHEVGPALARVPDSDRELQGERVCDGDQHACLEV
eukprot:1264095-Rhodomonas_salina.2